MRYKSWPKYRALGAAASARWPGCRIVLNGTNNSLTVLVPSLYHFANRDLGPIPLVVILLIVLVILAVYVVTMTRLAHPGRGWRRARPEGHLGAPDQGGNAAAQRPGWGGGRGAYIGRGALGLLVIAGVTDIIAVKSINTYYTDVIVGVLLLLAVYFDRIRGGDS